MLRIFEEEIETSLMTKQEGDNNNNNIDSTSPSILKEQRQIVLNFYNSGIEPDVIAYQLDIGLYLRAGA